MEADTVGLSVGGGPAGRVVHGQQTRDPALCDAQDDGDVGPESHARPLLVAEGAVEGAPEQPLPLRQADVTRSLDGGRSPLSGQSLQVSVRSSQFEEGRETRRHSGRRRAGVLACCDHRCPARPRQGRRRSLAAGARAARLSDGVGRHELELPPTNSTSQRLPPTLTVNRVRARRRTPAHPRDRLRHSAPMPRPLATVAPRPIEQP